MEPELSISVMMVSNLMVIQTGTAYWVDNGQAVHLHANVSSGYNYVHYIQCYHLSLLQQLFQLVLLPKSVSILMLPSLVLCLWLDPLLITAALKATSWLVTSQSPVLVVCGNILLHIAHVKININIITELTIIIYFCCYKLFLLI